MNVNYDDAKRLPWASALFQYFMAAAVNYHAHFTIECFPIFPHSRALSSNRWNGRKAAPHANVHGKSLIGDYQFTALFQLIFDEI